MPKLEKKSVYILQVDEDELEAIIESLNEKSGSMVPDEGAYYDELALSLDNQKKKIK